MKTFGFIGTYDPHGGAYGIGAVKDSVLANAVVTTRLGVTDAVHPTPHNGTDVASLDGPNADLFAPADGVVMRNYPNVWVGPGPKVLYSYDDETGHHEKVVQPGELDRGGNELWLYHPGPFLLPDGSTVLSAATRYCHLAELPELPFGTEVKAGQKIGRQGTTGVSTGEHLHWALQFQRTAAEFFPANWDDFTRLVDPCTYIGVTGSPDTLTVPSGGFDIGVVASLWQYVVAGGSMPDVDVESIPSTRDGWDAWRVERKSQ